MILARFVRVAVLGFSNVNAMLDVARECLCVRVHVSGADVTRSKIAYPFLPRKLATKGAHRTMIRPNFVWNTGTRPKSVKSGRDGRVLFL